MIWFLETPSQIWVAWGDPSLSLIEVMEMWIMPGIVIGFLETPSHGFWRDPHGNCDWFF